MSEALQLAHTDALVDKFFCVFFFLFYVHIRSLDYKLADKRKCTHWILWYLPSITKLRGLRWTETSLQEHRTDFIVYSKIENNSSVSLQKEYPSSIHFYIYGSRSNTEKAASPCVAATYRHQHKLSTKQSRWADFSGATVKSLAFNIGSHSSSSVIWHMCITVVQSKAGRINYYQNRCRSFTHIWSINIGSQWKEFFN